MIEYWQLNMVENQRERIAASKEIGGTMFSEGNVVLVLRDVGSPELETGEEEAGIILDIEQGGRVFINYGGVVSLLHDEDQIRHAPEKIREALTIRLKQNNEDLQAEGYEATKYIRGILEEYRQNDTFFKWLVNSVKLRFRKSSNE